MRISPSYINIFRSFLFLLLSLSGIAVGQITHPNHNQATLCIKTSVGSLFDGVELSPGKDSVQCITVTNCGDSVEIIKASVGTTDYILSQKTSPPLQPDSSFTFCLTFHPKTIGSHQAFLFLDYGLNLKYISLSGTTPCAHLTSLPAALSFDTVVIGQKSVKTFTLTNDGDYFWKAGAAYFFPDDGTFVIQSPLFDTVPLAPHESRIITVQFAPQTAGNKSTTITFPEAGPCGNALQIPVSGSGGCAYLTTIPTKLSFPIIAVGSRDTLLVTVKNIGSYLWMPKTPTVTSPFKIVTNIPNTFAIRLGDSLLLQVEYAPLSSGSDSAIITFPDAVPCGNTIVIEVSGKSACSILDFYGAAVPNTLPFGKSKVSIEILNFANFSWTPGSPLITPPSSPYTVISMIPATIAPGGQATLTLEFAPKSYGEFIAKVTFPNATPCQDSSVSVDLDGKAISNSVSNNNTNGFSLEQNFPNPFIATTSFNYSLPKETEVKLAVYNMTGKLVKTLVLGRVSEGQHRVIFDAHDLPSGSYLLILESGSIKLSREIILTK